MNTLLVEASPTNYQLLRESRAYDYIVHAALCDNTQATVDIAENAKNSGENKISRVETKRGSDFTTTVTTTNVKCTTIDAELDKLRATLPANKQDKLQLAFLVLDVEGFETIAITGIQKYAPLKAMIETKSQTQAQLGKLSGWAHQHNLQSQDCRYDTCYNFAPPLSGQARRELFFGSRRYTPENTWMTSTVHEAYNFFGY
jgi:hypothetical protein